MNLYLKFTLGKTILTQMQMLIKNIYNYKSKMFHCARLGSGLQESFGDNFHICKLTEIKMKKYFCK